MAYMRICLLCFESDGIRVPSTSAEIKCIHGARDFGQHVQMKQWHHFIFHVDGYVGLDQSSYRVHEVTRKSGAVGGRSEICRYAGGLMAIGIFLFLMVRMRIFNGPYIVFSIYSGVGNRLRQVFSRLRRP